MQSAAQLETGKMPEYEYGVQWKSNHEVVFAGAEEHARTVYESLTKSMQSITYPDQPVLVRRPKGDWEETK